MSAITPRYTPFHNVFRLHDELNRLFDGAPRATPFGSLAAPLAASWSPPVDIYEDDDGVTLRAELPGVDPEAVDLSVENDTLTLKGERKLHDEEKRENYRRIERTYGSFTRSFKLPNTVDAAAIRAEYRNGILNVFLPRREDTRPRQIRVKVEQAS